MTYFQNTTDASQQYRPNSAAAGSFQDGTIVRGNLSDLMRNATVVKGTFVVPTLVHSDIRERESTSVPMYGIVW